MKLWPTSAILLLVTIYLARTGMGYVLSLSGPTLLYLTELVNTEIQSFSLAFSLRFVGVIIGGVMVGFVMHRTKEQINQLYLMAIFLFLKGLFNLITPWLTSIWIMSIAIMVIGITFGYLDAGLQAIILRIWGATTSRPLIYLYHFTIGIGGIFAPIIAEPFLLEAYGHRENNPNCPGNSTSNDSSTSAVGDEELNPVAWSYIIIGIYFFVITILTLALAYFKTDEKAFQKFSASENVTVEKRKEEPIRDLIWVFAPLIGYYFCSVSNEILFNSFIYPVAVCSELKFSIPDATLVNSLYWIGLMVGRGSGIFAASYIRPAKIAIFCIAGTIIMMWILVLFGRTTPQVTWAVSIVHGFFVGPLYPSGVTWISQVTNVSGKYMFIFILGGMTGCTTMLSLGGWLFKTSPFHVMYLACALSCANALCFAGAVFAAKCYKKNRRQEAEGEIFLNGKNPENGEVKA